MGCKPQLPVSLMFSWGCHTWEIKCIFLLSTCPMPIYLLYQSKNLEKKKSCFPYTIVHSFIHSFHSMLAEHHTKCTLAGNAGINKAEGFTVQECGTCVDRYFVAQCEKRSTIGIHKCFKSTEEEQWRRLLKIIDALFQGGRLSSVHNCRHSGFLWP